MESEHPDLPVDTLLEGLSDFRVTGNISTNSQAPHIQVEQGMREEQPEGDRRAVATHRTYPTSAYDCREDLDGERMESSGVGRGWLVEDECAQALSFGG